MKKEIISKEFIRFQKLAGISLTENIEKTQLSDKDIESLKAIGQSMQDIRREAELKISQLEKQRKEIESELADR